MDGQLFTWAALSAMGGASLLTYLVVLYTKELVAGAVPGLPTALYAVIVGFIVLVVAQLGGGANPADWRLYALSLANSFLVSATAGHMNEKTLKPPGAKKGDNASGNQGN
jgi:hypothetical protein